MNKLVTVLGVAAVATLAGCKDPNYKPMSSQNDVKTVEPVHCTCPAGTVHETPCACGADDCLCVVEVKSAPAPKCSCAPGTKHTTPCACAAADCKCVVEPAPAPAPAPVVKSTEPETTTYIVQPGDYLAKISKKYNVTINSIKKLNNLKSDTVRIGQKLKLPGKIDVGEQKVKTTPKAAAPKKGYQPYKGETKEYVVKAGDTLGAVAYGNGCNIRQLKELNGLTSDVLRIGQKLKVPAGAKAASAAKKPVEVQKINELQSKVAPVGVIAAESTAETAAPEVAPVADPETVPVAETPAPAAETTTYVVQEGDDMTGVSIRFCVSAGAIRELNNLAEDAQLTPGQIIKLPADAQQ